MIPSPKQITIIKFLEGKQPQSKKQMMDSLLVSHWYYHNAEKHFGDILSRMVNSGLLKREKKGFYSLLRKEKVNFIINPNQTELFK